MERVSGDITKWLRKWTAGGSEADGELAQVVYRELHRLAKLHMARERNKRTLQPTALVNEAYLRLRNNHGVAFQNRAHFFALAAREMKRVLIDVARVRSASKRGGPGVRHVDLDEVAIYTDENWSGFLDLHAALERLAVIDPRAHQIIELRYFGGLSIQEVADVMNLSYRTITREWEFAKAWLHKQLAGGVGDGSAG
jgi:RNA polymerase sigma-70 factor, ECF subfamily